MKSSLVVLLSLFFLAGCMTTRPPRAESMIPASGPVAMAPLPTTRIVELRYEVRGYQDPANPLVRHEAHAVYRRTRLPLTAAEPPGAVPRDAFPPASVTPLPPSVELNAELGTQRKLTAELRAAQAALTDTAERMQSQYTALVRQSTETAKLREQLAAERMRLQSAPPPAPVAPTGGTIPPTEAKW